MMNFDFKDKIIDKQETNFDQEYITFSQYQEWLDMPYNNVSKFSNLQKINQFFNRSNRTNAEAQQYEDREILSNHPDTELPNNKIQTNKYNKFNLIPLLLFEQLSKKANLYFVIIGILQIIPQLTISDGVPTIFLPLCFIILISSLKDIYEDSKRKQSDHLENSKLVNFLNRNGSKGEFDDQITWENMRVGQIIKVEKDEYFPADILILQTSDLKGNCNIETKNIDGETNLKIKNCQFMSFYRDQNIQNLKFKVKYDPPNHFLYKFFGNLILYENNKEDNLWKKKIIQLNYDNFILRSSVLKNTDYVKGIVLYTGHDTKIMQNYLQQQNSKRCSLQIKMDHFIQKCFYIQMFLCIFGSMYNMTWQYLYYDIEYGHSKFTIIGNWILIFTNFVPISLLVTLEVVKFIQGLQMINDNQMANTNVQTSNLNEELGQISHIFSDKTGTLTQNQMEFKQILIENNIYGDLDIEDPNYIQDDVFQTLHRQNVDFRDYRIFEILSDYQHQLHEITKRMIFILSICHTVIRSNFQNPNQFEYESTSPDELALVQFANFANIKFCGEVNQNGMNRILIKFNNQDYYFEKLYVFEFDNVRKRQSIVVKNEKGEYYLFCKGADNIILQKSSNSDEYQKKIITNLKKFGEKGLRTLLIAERKLERDQFLVWEQNYKNIISSSLSLYNSNQNQNQEIKTHKIEQCWNSLEQNMRIIGATAIEDKLQNQVPETIQAFRNAGIKIWILTGDKMETAINIGFQSNLLDNSMSLIIISEENEGLLKISLSDHLQELEDQNQQDQNFALILTGEALNNYIAEIHQMIYQIAKKCKVAICCRLAPLQKQLVVQLIKDQEPDSSILAIGDGANDVNMITSAHVGVGIRGREGQQAAWASDYSISEFQNLRILLFYHGRECYRRNSKLAFYMFQKNFILVLPLFWYGFYNNFSAQILYDKYIYQLFNILFTSFPIINYALFDEEYNSKQLIQNKQKNYYKQGIINNLFNNRLFSIIFIQALGQSLLLSYISLHSLESNFIVNNGQFYDLIDTGIMIFFMIVVVMNIKLLMISNTFNIASVIIQVFSITTLLISWALFNINSFSALNQAWNTYLCILLTIGAFVLLDHINEYILKHYQNKRENTTRKNIFPKNDKFQNHKSFPIIINTCDYEFIGIPQNNKYFSSGYAYSQIDKQREINQNEVYQ